MQKFYPLNWKFIGMVSVAALVIVTLFSSVGGATVSAQTDIATGPVNSISVSGTGQASGTPDVAYINLGVDTVDPEVGQAVENANAEMAAIIAALTDAGVDPKDIQTTNFNVYPEDRYDQNGQPTGERVYHVQNSLTVTVRDITNVGTIIEAGLGAGADSINGLNFGIDNTAELEQEARVNAIADARQRAEQLAAAFGVTLGDPIIISEVSGGYYQPPMPLAARDAMGGSAAQITPGQLQVSVQVNVTFAIGS